MEKKCFFCCCEQRECPKPCCCCEQKECPKPEPQCHVHEILGSVMIAERKREDKCCENCCDRHDRCGDKHEDRCRDKCEKHEGAHNHRFATVSCEEIPVCGHDHVHEIEFKTDFTDGHYHTFKGRSSGMICVGDGRHVHFAKAFTSENDGHCHEFRVAALIEDPIGKK